MFPSAYLTDRCDLYRAVHSNLGEQIKQMVASGMACRLIRNVVQANALRPLSEGRSEYNSELYRLILPRTAPLDVDFVRYKGVLYRVVRELGVQMTDAYFQTLLLEVKPVQELTEDA